MNRLQTIGMGLLATALVACTSTVGNNVVTDKGRPQNTQLDWPNMDDATRPEGIFPNLANLAQIGSGLTKRELYYLIERPHFHETHGAREWNYIMKFRQPDRSVKVCQYKILFDRDEKARSFFWLPSDCMKGPEKFALSADALFPFNRGGVNDIKPLGREKLDRLAARIVKDGNKARVRLVGHTDYIGNDAYNMKLSQQRAYSVGRYLIERGVAAANVTAEGRGEAQPVKQCQSQSKRALIQCLAPNRRVDVEIRR